jgi:hypothetical protein
MFSDLSSHVSQILRHHLFLSFISEVIGSCDILIPMFVLNAITSSELAETESEITLCVYHLSTYFYSTYQIL